MKNKEIITKDGDKATEVFGYSFIQWAKVSDIKYKHFATINRGKERWEWYILFQDNNKIHVDIKETSKGFIIKRKQWKSKTKRFKKPNNLYRYDGDKLW